MSPLVTLGVMFGAIAGAGALLVVAGLREREVTPAFTEHVLAKRIEAFSLRAGLAACFGGVTLLVTRWPVASLLMAVLGFCAPSLFGGQAGRAKAIARIEAIATWTEMLRDTMAAAAGIEQSIIATAVVAPAPIRHEVAVLAARLESREKLSVALREFATSLADPTGDLVVAALLLASEKQARNLGQLLGTLSASTREQATMRLRIEASRSGTRTEVRVITSTVIGMAVGLTVLNREFLKPYDSVVGQGVLAVIGVLFIGAFYWLASAARTGGPERFLTGMSSEPAS